MIFGGHHNLDARATLGVSGVDISDYAGAYLYDPWKTVQSDRYHVGGTLVGIM
jgi:hypothetical protein